MAIRQEQQDLRPEPIGETKVFGKRLFKKVYVQDFTSESIYKLIEEYGMDAPVFRDDCSVCKKEFVIRARLAYSHLKRYPRFFPPDRCKVCFTKSRSAISTPTPPGNAQLHVKFKVFDEYAEQTPLIAARSVAPKVTTVSSSPAAALTYNNYKNRTLQPRAPLWRRLLNRSQESTTAPAKIPGKSLEGHWVKLHFKKKVSFSNHDESDAPLVGYCMTYGYKSIVVTGSEEEADEAFKYATTGVTIHYLADIQRIELLDGPEK